MACERCGGFTIEVSFRGGLTAHDLWEYNGRKCVNCGHVTDPVIQKHKTVHMRRQHGPANVGRVRETSRSCDGIAA